METRIEPSASLVSLHSRLFVPQKSGPPTKESAFWSEFNFREESVKRSKSSVSLSIAAEEHVGSYRALVEAAPTGLMSVDVDGVIRLVNRQIETLFGYTRNELLGQKIEMLIPARFKASHPKKREGFVTTPSDRLMGEGRPLFGCRKDGTEFPLEIGLSPEKGDGGALVHCSIIDVTTRRAEQVRLNQHIDELRRNRTQTALLDEMTSFLQYASNEAEALKIVEKFGKQMFAENGVGFYLLPQSGDSLELVCFWNEFKGERTSSVGNCWALRRSHPHRSGGEEPATCMHHGDTFADERWATCVPISAHGQWLGILVLQGDSANDEREYVERTGALVADQVGLALSNLQLRERLRNLAIRDGMTGLFNRRYLDETAVRELKRASRLNSTMGVVMIDVDHFKKFNDEYGHQAADDVLVRVSKIFASKIRDEDVACRYGGEEFVLLLPGADKEQTSMRAEEIRLAVETIPVRKVTVSMGVSVFPENGVDWEALLRSADTALYTAKNTGRNRVEVAQE